MALTEASIASTRNPLFASQNAIAPTPQPTSRRWTLPLASLSRPPHRRIAHRATAGSGHVPHWTERWRSSHFWMLVFVAVSCCTFQLLDLVLELVDLTVLQLHGHGRDDRHEPHADDETSPSDDHQVQELDEHVPPHLSTDHRANSGRPAGTRCGGIPRASMGSAFPRTSGARSRCTGRSRACGARSLVSPGACAASPSPRGTARGDSPGP